jgi:hypothetical protein
VGGHNELESFIMDNEITMSAFFTGCAFILGLIILVACETIREAYNARNQ